MNLLLQLVFTLAGPPMLSTPEIDLEDLDRYMQYHGAQYEKRISKFGDAELTATGDAAEALAAWLSTVFATGVRERPRSP